MIDAWNATAVCMDTRPSVVAFIALSETRPAEPVTARGISHPGAAWGRG